MIACVVADGKGVLRFAALHFNTIITLRQACNLQFRIKLIRPEPGNRIIIIFDTQKRIGCMFALIDGVLHALQPNVALIAVPSARRTRSACPLPSIASNREAT